MYVRTKNSSPLISIVIPSRNDNYMGNPNWRLETTINFIAAELASIGRLDDVEVIVVDWGSEFPLHKELRLTDLGQHVARYIVVPVSVHEEVMNDSNLPDSIALNVGIRRSNGEYVMQLGNDVLFSASCLDKLIGSLEGENGETRWVNSTKSVLMVFPHKGIPFDLVQSEPTLEELRTFIENNSSHLPVTRLIPYLWGESHGILAHRNLWFECRGFDEKLIYWGWWEIDFILRIRLKYYTFDMFHEQGMYSYHLEHYKPVDGDAQLLQQNPKAKRLNPYVFGPFQANDDDWGLGSLEFEECPNRVTGKPREFPRSVLENKVIIHHKIRHLLNILRFAFSKAGWSNFKDVRTILSLYRRYLRKGYDQ